MVSIVRTIIMSMFLIFVVVMLLKRETLETKKIRKILGIIMISSDIIFHIIIVAMGTFSWGDHMPFELCDMMEITAVFALWANNRKIMEILTIPISLFPIIAIVYPSDFKMLESDIINCIYFYFWHFLLITTGVYFLFVEKIHIQVRTPIYSWIFTQCCIPVAVIANFVFPNGNYMVLAKPIIHFLNPLFYYIGYEGVFLFVSMFIPYVLIVVFKKIKNRKYYQNGNAFNIEN